MLIRQNLGITLSKSSDWNLFINITTIILFVGLLYETNIVNRMLNINNYGNSIKILPYYLFTADTKFYSAMYSIQKKEPSISITDFQPK